MSALLASTEDISPNDASASASNWANPAVWLEIDSSAAFRRFLYAFSTLPMSSPSSSRSSPRPSRSSVIPSRESAASPTSADASAAASPISSRPCVYLSLYQSASFVIVLKSSWLSFNSLRACPSSSALHVPAPSSSFNFAQAAALW